jgi:A/G-specific adenine glycosylase
MAKPTQFAIRLLRWHEGIDRDLPWKKNRNPYQIWLSEIIMQQTRVAQGTPYYLKFVSEYPTITDLADAPEDDIMKLWQGLGYYSRARNLHHAAKTVRDEFDGDFPTAYKDILSLKGVGKYTAAAIASFAYGLEYAVVDGNVIRVLSRYYGITDAVDQSSTLRFIQEKADLLIKGSDPSDYNQAIMDFGALQCTPKSPNCAICAFEDTCTAYQKELVSIIPTKAKKIKKRTRYLHYLILEDSAGRVIIHHRREKDIWQSLYDYHCIESLTDTQLGEEEIRKDVLDNFGLEVESIIYPTKAYKHILTHQTLYGQFYQIKVDQISNINSPYLNIDQGAIPKYAMPVLITNYLDDTKKDKLFS